METETVKVSPKFQVVIPKKIREELKIRPGRHLVIIKKGEIIYLVPVGKMQDAIGIAVGVESEGVRDESERFD